MRFALASIAAAAGLFAAVAPASSSRVFGPPLLCYAFDIGSARSLPWGKGDAFAVDPSFDRSRLVPETLAILAESRDPLVHMETLRRAVIYVTPFEGGGSRSQTLNADTALLAARLLDKALRNPDALAFLDAGYFVEAEHQMSRNLGFTGVDYLEKAATLAPGDAACQLAAAAGCFDSMSKESRDRMRSHFDAALKSAASGSLVRTNVVGYGNHYLGKEVMEKLLAGEKSKG